MKFPAIVLISLVLTSQCFAQESKPPSRPPIRSEAKKPETPHLEFVTEYIRELAAVERIRADSGEDQVAKDGKLPSAGMIHTATAFDLELSSQIHSLSDMRLNPPYDYLIPAIVDFHEQRIKIWRRMGEIGTEFIAGPKDGVDYGQLGAELPKLRAELEYLDTALFEVTLGVFATLIDKKADSNGRAHHLIITKEEKAALISMLNGSFGEKLEQEKPNCIVGAARMLRDQLNEDLKCSDEPWD